MRAGAAAAARPAKALACREAPCITGAESASFASRFGSCASAIGCPAVSNWKGRETAPPRAARTSRRRAEWASERGPRAAPRPTAQDGADVVRPGEVRGDGGGESGQNDAGAGQTPVHVQAVPSRAQRKRGKTTPSLLPPSLGPNVSSWRR